MDAPKPHGSSSDEKVPNGANDTNGHEKAAEVIFDLLLVMVDKKASDLHIRSGCAPIFRIDGNLASVNATSLSPDTVRDSLYHMISPRQS